MIRSGLVSFFAIVLGAASVSELLHDTFPVLHGGFGYVATGMLAIVFVLAWRNLRGSQPSEAMPGQRSHLFWSVLIAVVLANSVPWWIGVVVAITLQFITMLLARMHWRPRWWAPLQARRTAPGMTTDPSAANDSK